jgi:hypothetical protein
LLRVLERMHGHLGWLAALALYHPAILLRRPRRRALIAAGAATGLITSTALLGMLLYPSYRMTVKPLLWAQAPLIGGLFERKEHLGMAAVVLAWAGLAAHWAAVRDRFAPAGLERSAWIAYVAAAALATLVASLGIIVAAHLTF